MRGLAACGNEIAHRSLGTAQHRLHTYGVDLMLCRTHHSIEVENG